MLLIVGIVFFPKDICIDYSATLCIHYHKIIEKGQIIQEGVYKYRLQNGYLPHHINIVPLGKTLENGTFKYSDQWGNLYVYRFTKNLTDFYLYSKGVNGIDENMKNDDIVIHPIDVNKSVKSIYCQ